MDGWGEKSCLRGNGKKIELGRKKVCSSRRCAGQGQNLQIKLQLHQLPWYPGVVLSVSNRYRLKRSLNYLLQ